MINCIIKLGLWLYKITRHFIQGKHKTALERDRKKKTDRESAGHGSRQTDRLTYRQKSSEFLETASPTNEGYVLHEIKC